MLTSNSKKKLGRREVPFLGSLLENLPYSRLPTKRTVIIRLMFITETNSASVLSINDDAITIDRGEIKDVWSRELCWL